MRAITLLLQGRADYFGPGVNLAARLMVAATPEVAVVVSSETAQAMFRYVIQDAVSASWYAGMLSQLFDI